MSLTELFIVKLEHILTLFLVFSLLTLYSSILAGTGLEFKSVKFKQA